MNLKFVELSSLIIRVHIASLPIVSLCEYINEWNFYLSFISSGSSDIIKIVFVNYSLWLSNEIKIYITILEVLKLS